MVEVLSEVSEIEVGFQTLWLNDADDPAKLRSPEYTAEIVWLPAASEDVVRAAVPELRATVPSTVAPSRN